MNRVASSPLFFLHIMKTGGATFRQHVYRNFGEGEVYPVPGQDDMSRAWLVEYLLSVPAERRARFRAYTGHFPFVVTELLQTELVTFTLLRDPIERTISYLKHCKRYHERHRDLDLEEIYEDPFYFGCFIHNHQSKLFSMTIEDEPESYMDIVDVDDRRLEIAKANLEKVDVLGLSERHNEFVDDLRIRFGFRSQKIPNRRVSREAWDAAPTLRRRIEADNGPDLEFYDFGRRLYEQRRQAVIGA